MEHSIPPSITVAAMQQHERLAVVELLHAQELRHAALDPRLHAPRTREELASLLSTLSPNGYGALVARDQQGLVRGAVIPALWELAAESMLLAFLTPRNGITQLLTLPNPQEDAETVTSALLLAALSHGWRELHTTGDLIRWPSTDPWIARALLAHGFLLDSFMWRNCAITRRAFRLRASALRR